MLRINILPSWMRCGSRGIPKARNRKQGRKSLPLGRGGFLRPSHDARLFYYDYTSIPI